MEPNQWLNPKMDLPVSPWLSLALPDYFLLVLHLEWRIRFEETNPIALEPKQWLNLKMDLPVSPCLSLALPVSPWLSLALPDYFLLVLHLEWRIRVKETNPIALEPNQRLNPKMDLPVSPWLFPSSFPLVRISFPISSSRTSLFTSLFIYQLDRFLSSA